MNKKECLYFITGTMVMGIIVILLLIIIPAKDTRNYQKGFDVGYYKGENKGSFFDTCNKTEVLVIYFNGNEVSKTYLDYNTKLPTQQISIFDGKPFNNLTLISHYEDVCNGDTEPLEVQNR